MLEQLDRQTLAKACEAVPLFPLPGVVLFPNTVMPLHVFEDRYRRLVRDCLAGNGVLGVPLLAPGWENNYDGQPPIHPISGLGRIIESRKLADGRYNIAVLGVGRMRILSEHATDEPYRIARAELLEEVLPASGISGLRGSLDQMRLLLAQLLMLYPRLQPDLGKLVEEREPSPQLIDALAHLVFQEPEERQQYLEEDRLLTRADKVAEGLASVIARASSDIPEA